jgi:hypothetical protein
MTNRPKRRFWQILSTAVVLMLTAGGLIWANVSPTLSGRVGIGYDRTGMVHELFGWPFVYKGYDSDLIAPDDGSFSGNLDDLLRDPYYIAAYKHNNVYIFRKPPGITRPRWMFVDGLISILILSATCCLCEYLIRRERSRLPEEPR